MTVHISDHTNFMGFNHGAFNAKRCTICDHVLHYPFLQWAGKLFLCSRCSRKMKKGLTADLIHINAILDIQEVGYHCTLVRETEESLWHQRKLEEEAEERVMMGDFTTHDRIRQARLEARLDTLAADIRPKPKPNGKSPETET